MSVKKYIVLVGAGYWGSKILEKLLKLNQNVIIFDKDINIHKNLKNKINSNTIIVNNLNKINNFDFDSVVISSPAQFHFEHIKFFMKLNKNIFVEKPLCINFNHINYIKKKLINYKKTFMVGHIMHHHNAFKKILYLKRKNFFGKILYIYSSRLSFGKLRKHENILSSFAPHDLSMILSIMKSKPTITNCSGSKILSKKVYDNSIINMKFKNKINSHIFVNWLSPFKEQKFVIVGNKNMLVFDDTQDWNNKLMCIKKPLFYQNKSYVLNSKKISYIKINKNDALLDEIKYFLSCNKYKKKPISNIDESFQIYGLLDQAIKKLKINEKK